MTAVPVTCILDRDVGVVMGDGREEAVCEERESPNMKLTGEQELVDEGISTQKSSPYTYLESATTVIS